jgi:iron(III) transport system permease protein
MDAAEPVNWLGEGRMLGVVIMEVLHLYPIIYLNAAAALANLDPALEEAASNLGCTGWRRFQRITLPLIMPGVFAGGTIVFVWAFTEMGVPLVFDFERVTAVQVFRGINDLSGNPFPVCPGGRDAGLQHAFLCRREVLLQRQARATGGGRATTGRD